MSMVPIRPGQPGFRYTDPIYQQLARMAEQAEGLPSGILDAIRTRGERSNANQVSEAGARSVYQFIEPTRRGMIKNYGVDPWSGPEAATTAAAKLVKENYGRTGSWDDAVAMYHGGTNRRNWGPRTRAYASRVGSFDQPEAQWEEAVLGQSLYPQPYYGTDPLAPLPVNPLAPERPKETAPVTPDAGPSTPVPAASQAAAKKRGGILGSIGRVLEAVFAPDPGSLYGAAMNNPNGIWGAKGAQAAYRQAQQKGELENQMTQAKLKNFLTKGEYQVVGNNVFHFPPDGGEPVIITPPRTLTDKETLLERWQGLQDGDPAKELIERMLTGANSDAALASRERQASTRAGATVSSARIRANAPSKSSAAPKYEYKEVNGKLMRRRIN